MDVLKKAVESLHTHGMRNLAKKVEEEINALVLERDELLELYGPDYHVADIHDDGWSIQHPIPCRRSLLDCDLHLAASHKWHEKPAPSGRYRADLTDDGRIALVALEEK